MGAAALAALTSMAGNAHATAAIYNVTTTSTCTLADAMEAINRGAAFGTCAKPGLDPNNPDIIKLQAGKTFKIFGYPPATPPASPVLTPGTLFIKKAVKIQSATANTMAILMQNGPTRDGQLGAVIFINLPPEAATVSFTDIDLVGTGATNRAIGIGIQGNDQSSTVSLTQSWVRNFNLNGIYDQNASLTLQDSAIDNNGSNTGFNDGDAIFIESVGHTSTTRLFMDHSSITNNKDNALFTELGHGSVSTIRNSTISNNTGTYGGVRVGGPDNNYKMRFIGSTVAFNGGGTNDACGITCHTPDVAGIPSR
ncbi:MAG: hypothetical protein ABUS79_02585 [Pseudomonadota bacterium]